MLTLLHHLEIWFAQHGLPAVFGLLLLENAGLPLPGETVLLYAAFLAEQHHGFHLVSLYIVAVGACILGDNTGYWLGRKARRPLTRLLRLTPARLRLAERYFQKYGHATIFFARFIAVLRILAGPAAGVNHMKWRTFFLFNALGAAAWVASIVALGAVVGHHWNRWASRLGKMDAVLLVVAVVAIYAVLHRLLRQLEIQPE